MSERVIPDARCTKHPNAGIHFGEVTQVFRCNYCNRPVQ